MKTAKMLTILVLALGLMVWSGQLCDAAEMGTAFTYQGHLYDANYPADGLYDFQFKLFDDPCDPCDANQIGGDVNKPDVDVTDGYFTVVLDFGSDVFDGNAVFLEIDVRPGDSNDVNDFVTLSPRQPITPTPYAIYANKTRGIFVDSSGNVGIGTTNPQDKLDVSGNITVRGTTIKDAGGTPRITLTENGGLALRDYTGTEVLSVESDELYVYAQVLLEGDTSIDSAQIAGDLSAGGNVGIGTTNPAAKLHINGSDARIIVQDDDNASSYTEIDDAQPTQLRINKHTESGTTMIDMNPMPVDGSSDAALRFFRETDTTGAKTVKFYKGDGTTTHHAQIGVDGADSYLQTGGGNVGIGTTSPTEKLEVDGNAKITGDLIVDGSINGSISGGIKQLVADFVVAAGESVTAGDVVSFLDGYVQKGFVAGSPTGDSITYGPKAVFNLDTTYGISAAALSDSKFVVAYYYHEILPDVYHGTAVIGQITGGAITYGTDYEFSSDLHSLSEISVAALSATKFVVVYTESTLNDGYARIGEVSGDTITYGTANFFNTFSYYISVTALTSAKFVVAYCDNGNSNYGTCVVGEVSGTTISYGAEHVFNSYNTTYISVDALSTTKFLMAYDTYSGTDNGAAKIGEVPSGTNITYGAESIFNLDTTYGISAAALSDSKFVVAYKDGGNSNYGTAIIGQISGFTITFGLEHEFNTAVTGYTSATALSSNRFVVAFNDGVIGIGRIGLVSGYTITYGPDYQFNAGDAYYISSAALSDRKFVVSYQDTGNRFGTAIVGDSPVDLGDAVVGIASDSKTAGQTVPVIIGGVSDVHSGLTAGSVYYAAESGDLTTSANNYRVGVAASDTEILLNSDRDNEDQFFGDMIFANNFRITEASAYEGLIFKNQLGSEILNITGQGNLNIRSVIRLEPGSAPASPLAGDLYFDSADNKLKCYDGTTWQACF